MSDINEKLGNTQPYELEPETTEQAVARLSKLSPLEYDKTREAEAKALGVRVGTLDSEVRRAREPDAEAKGREINLYQPEPWPDPVDGADVLDEARRAIRRYVVLRDEDAVTAALWAAHTHVYDVFSHTPRLAITAPNEECGKSLLGTHLIGALVPRPFPVDMMKPAPFFRLAESLHPVFLIGEVDVFIKEDSDLLAALNNGWEPHGGVPRCVGEGANLEVRVFSTHTPVCLDGINLHKVLPATTLGRAHVITMDRATPEELETVEVYQARKHRVGLLEIGRKLARWCIDNRAALLESDPTLPAGVVSRRADKWRPLFAIAGLAGGEWPKLAKQACMADSGASKLSMSLQLLADIQSVFGPGEDKIKTKDLIERLCRIDESPWESYNFRARDTEQRRIQDRQVSGLLRDYRIEPTNVRANGAVVKGYKRQPIDKACKRYLPQTPNLSATPLQPNDGAGFGGFYPLHEKSGVADRTARKPLQHNGCSGVAAKTPLNGGVADKPAPSMPDREVF